MAPTQFLRGAAAYSLRQARRIAIAVMGGTLLVVGAALLVLPGPGLVVLALGLALLSLEFAWARVWLKRVKEKAGEMRAGAARYVPLLRQRDDP
jgi:tellurite resistance protein TerC